MLRLASMALEGCAGRIWLAGDRLELVPCARVEAGVHLGEIQPTGRGLAGAPWIAPGLAARVRLALVADLFAELDAWGLVPLRRTRFLEGTDTTPVFVTPALVGGGALGIGVSFP